MTGELESPSLWFSGCLWIEYQKCKWKMSSSHWAQLQSAHKKLPNEMRNIQILNFHSLKLQEITKKKEKAPTTLCGAFVMTAWMSECATTQSSTEEKSEYNEKQQMLVEFSTTMFQPFYERNPESQQQCELHAMQDSSLLFVLCVYVSTRERADQGERGKKH